MIKTSSSIVLIAILVGVIQYFLPWWTCAITCAVIAYFMKLKRAQGYLSGFVGVYLLWYGMSMFNDQFFDVPMSKIIGDIFGGISPQLTYTLTGLVGAIVGGLGGWLGASFVSESNSKKKYKFS